MATGRFADTGDLGLEAAGVQTDERGFLVVDSNQRTSNPRVFAAGDVSGAPQYVYVAAQTGRFAAAEALADSAIVVRHRAARRHIHHAADRLRRDD